MILHTIPVGITQTNCYIVGCQETQEGVVIDPGGHPQRILKILEEEGYANPLSVEIEFQGEPWPPLEEVDRSMKVSYEHLKSLGLS